MIHTALIPWLDPETIIQSAGPWALLVVCFIVFAESQGKFASLRAFSSTPRPKLYS